jgi:hypothetical protein
MDEERVNNIIQGRKHYAETSKEYYEKKPGAGQCYETQLWEPRLDYPVNLDYEVIIGELFRRKIDGFSMRSTDEILPEIDKIRMEFNNEALREMFIYTRSPFPPPPLQGPRAGMIRARVAENIAQRIDDIASALNQFNDPLKHSIGLQRRFKLYHSCIDTLPPDSLVPKPSIENYHDIIERLVSQGHLGPAESLDTLCRRDGWAKDRAEDQRRLKRGKAINIVAALLFIGIHDVSLENYLMSYDAANTEWWNELLQLGRNNALYYNKMTEMTKETAISKSESRYSTPIPPPPPPPSVSWRVSV